MVESEQRVIGEYFVYTVVQRRCGLSIIIWQDSPVFVLHTWHSYINAWCKLSSAGTASPL